MEQATVSLEAKHLIAAYQKKLAEQASQIVILEALGLQKDEYIEKANAEIERLKQPDLPITEGGKVAA